jgi:hypothetical protein
MHRTQLRTQAQQAAPAAAARYEEQQKIAEMTASSTLDPSLGSSVTNRSPQQGVVSVTTRPLGVVLDTTALGVVL